MSAAVLQAVDEVLAGGGDADDVLRAVVAALASEPSIAWAGIRFLEDGRLVLGPAAGEPDDRRRRTTPIVYRGDLVGELVVDGQVDTTVLEELALLVAPYVLLGWDTGGEAWVP